MIIITIITGQLAVGLGMHCSIDSWACTAIWRVTMSYKTIHVTACLPLAWNVQILLFSRGHSAQTVRTTSKLMVRCQLSTSPWNNFYHSELCHLIYVVSYYSSSNIENLTLLTVSFSVANWRRVSYISEEYMALCVVISMAFLLKVWPSLCING